MINLIKGQKGEYIILVDHFCVFIYESSKMEFKTDFKFINCDYVYKMKVNFFKKINKINNNGEI
jgi:hypothetical protein